MRFLGCALTVLAVNTLFAALVKERKGAGVTPPARGDRKWLAEGLGYLESAALAAEVPAARPEA